MKQLVLILEKNIEVRDEIKLYLKGYYEIYTASNIDEASKIVKFNPIQIVISHNSFFKDKTLVNKLKQIYPNISLLAYGERLSSDEVISIWRRGVDGYVEDVKKKSLLLSQVKECILKKEVLKSSNAKACSTADLEMIGGSTKIEKVKSEIVNADTMRILFIGETGVGKTKFAKWANHVLRRKENFSRPFEQVNCANIKRERFVDELFGHVKGAYTGAISDKKGLVELARGGDLFLDEIGDLDLECQAELLTFLDNYSYCKLGGVKKRWARVRIISATNRNLKKMVSEGTFRKDLYSRIAQRVIEIPSLRQRREDIPVLVSGFIKKFYGHSKVYSTEIDKLYKNYPWHEGNVRELEKACEYMCIQARDSKEISYFHIDPRFQRKNVNYFYTYDLTDVFKRGYRSFLKEFEKNLLSKAIVPNQSIRQNAIKLQMDRASLGRKLMEYKIPVRYDHKILN